MYCIIYDYNKKFRLLTFLSGYRKFHLNSSKGYNRKIISSQTAPRIIWRTCTYLSLSVPVRYRDRLAYSRGMEELTTQVFSRRGTATPGGDTTYMDRWEETENVNFISLLNFQTEIVRRIAVDSSFRFI